MVDIPREATLKLLINSKLNRRCCLGNVQFTFPNLHASSIFIYFDASEHPREYNKNVYVLFYPKIHRGGGRWYCGGKRAAAIVSAVREPSRRRRRSESRVRDICISIFFIAGLHFLRQLNSKSHYFLRERRKKRVRPSPEPVFQTSDPWLWYR